MINTKQRVQIKHLINQSFFRLLWYIVFFYLLFPIFFCNFVYYYYVNKFEIVSSSGNFESNIISYFIFCLILFIENKNRWAKEILLFLRRFSQLLSSRTLSSFFSFYRCSNKQTKNIAGLRQQLIIFQFFFSFTMQIINRTK